MQKTPPPARWVYKEDMHFINSSPGILSHFQNKALVNGCNTVKSVLTYVVGCLSCNSVSCSPMDLVLQLCMNQVQNYWTPKQSVV